MDFQFGGFTSEFGMLLTSAAALMVGAILVGLTHVFMSDPRPRDCARHNGRSA